jgi:hypothetical protein
MKTTFATMLNCTPAKGHTSIWMRVDRHSGIVGTNF